MTSLPFTQTLHKDRKMWRVLGIVTVAPDGLQVEWRSDEYERTWVRGRLRFVGRGKVHNVIIPWAFVDRVSYHGRLFRQGELRVRARTMDALDGLPGSEGPFWTARIAKPDRSRALELALSAEGAVSATMRLLSHRTRA